MAAKKRAGVTSKNKKTAKKSTSKETLQDLLVIKLQALYDVEQELVKALPKMAAKATNKELKQCFRNHQDETENHVARLEEAFDYLGEKPKKIKVEAIRGIVKDAEWVMKNVKAKDALDASLIAAASYAEHYEIAGYIAASSWAHELGMHDLESLLSETLEEEHAADVQMRDLGDTVIDAQILPSDSDANERLSPSQDE